MNSPRATWWTSTSNLASLPYTDDDEEMARRFDLLMLNLQLAILETSPKQERYQRQVMIARWAIWRRSRRFLRWPSRWN